MQTIIQKTLKDTMYYGNIPALVYTINYPYFTTTCSASSARKINEYYGQVSKDTETYCRTVLYPQAVENVRYRQTDTPPFNSYTLDVNFKITYNKGCVTSLYRDTYTYMGGAHGETKRESDTWNFNTGARLRLNDIYPLTPSSLSILQKIIERQITERLIANPGIYFEDYPSLLRSTFHSENFYLQPGRYVIYYQQYDIAPYASGLPEFDFPLSD